MFRTCYAALARMGATRKEGKCSACFSPAMQHWPAWAAPKQIQEVHALHPRAGAASKIMKALKYIRNCVLFFCPVRGWDKAEISYSIQDGSRVLPSTPRRGGERLAEEVQQVCNLICHGRRCKLRGRARARLSNSG